MDDDPRGIVELCDPEAADLVRQLAEQGAFSARPGSLSPVEQRRRTLRALCLEWPRVRRARAVARARARAVLGIVRVLLDRALPWRWFS